MGILLAPWACMRKLIFALSIVLTLSACRKDSKKGSRAAAAAAAGQGQTNGGKGSVQPPAAPTAPIHPVQLCVEKTCGPSTAAHFRWFQNTAETEQFTKYWDNTLVPWIKRIVRNDEALGQRNKQRLDRYFANGKTPVSSEVRGFLQLLHPEFIKPFNDNSEKFLKNDKGSFSIDRAELEKVLAPLPAYQQKALRAYTDQVYIPHIRAWLLESAFSDNPMASRAQSLFPGTDTAKAVKSYAERQLQRIAAVKEKIRFASLLTNPETLNLIKRAAKGEDLDLADAAAAMDTMTVVDLAYESITGELGEALKEVPYAPSEYDENARQKLYEDVLKDDSSETLAAFEKSCRAKMAVSYNNQVSAQQLQQFKRMEQEIRQAAKTVAAGYGRNSEEARILTNLVGGIQFTLPLPFAQQLKIKMTEIEISEKSTDITGWADEDIAGILALLKDRENEKDDDDEPCKTWKTPHLSDAAYSMLGQVNVSAFSVILPEIGVSVVAHEFGHVVAHKLRALHAEAPGTSKFTSSLNCVAKRNPFVTEFKELKPDENTTWSNEDWADHFSSLVILEMKKRNSLWTRSELSLACGLVESSDNFKKNELKPADNDPHSSNLLRLLLIGLDRGDLRAECRPLLTDAKLEGRQDLRCH